MAPGEPVPDWILPVRERAAEQPGALVEVLVQSRSGYVLTGAARGSWQHSIPATKELRYSITFRTLRQG